MAIRGLLYRAVCDICAYGCNWTGPNQFRVRDQAEEAGWTFRRRKDGQVAGRGGKDRCPTCTEAMGWAKP